MRYQQLEQASDQYTQPSPSHPLLPGRDLTWGTLTPRSIERYRELEQASGQYTLLSLSHSPEGLNLWNPHPEVHPEVPGAQTGLRSVHPTTPSPQESDLGNPRLEIHHEVPGARTSLRSVHPTIPSHLPLRDPTWGTLGQRFIQRYRQLEQS